MTNTPAIGQHPSAINRSIASLEANANNTIIVHYTCSDLSKSPTRVTSIGLLLKSDGETRIFSIKKEAEMAGAGGRLTENQKNLFEKAMLKRFYRFVRLNQNAMWVHWSMKDSTFGFAAIDHRYRVLGGVKPSVVLNERRIDLSVLVKQLYLPKFEPTVRPKGKLLAIAENNGLSVINGVSGKSEANLFDAGNFQLLEQSLICKVNSISSILDLTIMEVQNRNAVSSPVRGFSLRNLLTGWIKWIVFASLAVIGFFVKHRLEALVQKPWPELGKTWDAFSTLLNTL